MSTTPQDKDAVYIKKAAGYPGDVNSEDLQLHHCEDFCKIHDLDTVARYHDPIDVRDDFEWMMGDATQDTPPFDYIVAYKLRDFLWSLEEIVLRRNRLRANRVSSASTAETSR